MRPNWTRLKSNIPSKIRTKSKISFDLFWQDDLSDTAGKLCGITRFDPNQIVINTQQSDKEAVLTAAHEMWHAISDSYELGLTESQVVKLEKAFPYIMEFFLKLENGK